MMKKMGKGKGLLGGMMGGKAPQVDPAALEEMSKGGGMAGLPPGGLGGGLPGGMGGLPGGFPGMPGGKLPGMGGFPGLPGGKGKKK